MSLFTSVTRLSYNRARVAGAFRVGRKLSLLRWLEIPFASQMSSNYLTTASRWPTRLLFDAIGQCIKLGCHRFGNSAFATGGQFGGLVPIIVERFVARRPQCYRP